MDTDVVVVGGGATGASVARDCAMRGLDVTLLDRGGLSAGTSGRSHGLLHSGARYADVDPEGARECVQESRVLGDIAGAAVRRTGGLFVAADGDDPDYADEKLAACEDCGVGTEELTPGEARRRESALPEDVERAFSVPDAVVYPSRLVAATAAGAREHGAEVRLDAPVTDLETGEAGVAVEAGGDRIEARHVVNATGAWAEEVAAMGGVDLPMGPTAGVMVVVDRDVSRVLNRCRPPADGDIVVPHEGTAVLGTTSEAVDDPDDLPTRESAVERVVDECEAVLPGLSRDDVVRSYWGVRPLYAGDGEGRDATRGFRVFDHADDGAPGVTSVVGGKLTTARLMAEVVADRVCETLGHDALCRTAVEPLPGADDPDRLDALVAEFDAGGPADADVVEP